MAADSEFYGQVLQTVKQLRVFSVTINWRQSHLVDKVDNIIQLAAMLWWFTAAPKPLKIQVIGGHPAPRGRTAPIF